MFIDDLFNDEIIGVYTQYNFYKTEDGARVEVLVPGFRKEDLTVEVDGKELKLKGKRKQDDNKNDIIINRNFYKNDFEKLFVLPQEYENVNAECKDGILNIYLKGKTSKKTIKVL